MTDWRRDLRAETGQRGGGREGRDLDYLMFSRTLHGFSPLNNDMGTWGSKDNVTS